jgi:hypothetical protein
MPTCSKKCAHKVAQHPERKQRLKVARRRARHRQDPPKQHAVERKDNDDADKPPLLGKRRKDKVGLILGQKAQLALRAVAYPLATQLARAHRHGRLVGVVARAVDVGQADAQRSGCAAFDSHESQTATARKGHRACSNDRKEVLAREARDHHHAKPNERDDDSRAKVGLERHEHKHKPRIAPEIKMCRCCYLDMSARKIFGQGDNERELYKLDRLKGKGPNIKPRLSAQGASRWSWFFS